MMRDNHIPTPLPFFMDYAPNNHFSRSVSVFQGSQLPETALLAGYSALIDVFDPVVPLPLTLCAANTGNRNYRRDIWRIFPARYKPAPTLEGQLVFALTYQGLDLTVLKRLFERIDPCDLEESIQAKPSSGNMHRIWFVYEWLPGRELDIPDATFGTYARIVDPGFQLVVKGGTSAKHRGRNNRSGTRAFCLLVRCTTCLEHKIGLRHDERLREVVGDIPTGILARTAAFLLLKDSRSSYAIEGESPPHNRIQHWGETIGEAGPHPLDEIRLARLQGIIQSRPIVQIPEAI